MKNQGTSIRPALKVLCGNPANEYFVLDVCEESQSALLMRTDSSLYNNGSFYQQHKDGQDKPFYPFWASFDELYVQVMSYKERQEILQNEKNKS